MKCAPSGKSPAKVHQWNGMCGLASQNIAKNSGIKIQVFIKKAMFSRIFMQLSTLMLKEHNSILLVILVRFDSTCS